MVRGEPHWSGATRGQLVFQLGSAKGWTTKVATSLSENRTRKRVLVVYRHALLRDLVARLLSDAGADVVARVAVEDLDPTTLPSLDVNVIILDEAALPVLAKFDAYPPFSWAPSGVSKVISVGVGGRAMVAFSRHYVDDATVESLIDEALDSSMDEPRGSTNDS